MTEGISLPSRSGRVAGFHRVEDADVRLLADLCFEHVGRGGR